MLGCLAIGGMLVVLHCKTEYKKLGLTFIILTSQVCGWIIFFSEYWHPAIPSLDTERDYILFTLAMLTPAIITYKVLHNRSNRRAIIAGGVSIILFLVYAASQGSVLWQMLGFLTSSLLTWSVARMIDKSWNGGAESKIEASGKKCLAGNSIYQRYSYFINDLFPLTEST